MMIYTLITIYVADQHADALNPIVKTHLVTTDGKLAKNCFEAMVASEYAEQQSTAPILRLPEQHAEIATAQGGRLIISLTSTSEPVEITLGRPNW